MEKGADLADFCWSLWKGAGRDVGEYDDCDVEMGDSPYSDDQVNDLIADACRTLFTPNHQVTYLNSAKAETPEHGRRLLSGLLSMLAGTSTLIAHPSDLEKMNVGPEERMEFGFQKPQGFKNWLVHTGNVDREDSSY